MQDLVSTVGLLAGAAVALATIAVILVVVLWVRVRRVRAAQRAVLGDGSQDLVTHAAGLQDEFGRLRAEVDQYSAALHDRLGEAERRLDGAIAYRALIRYDAYNEMSGRQSYSIALLDASRSGVVVSSIHHREQARLYAKQLHAGEPELELSPEEADVVRLALDGGGQGAPATFAP